MLHLVPPPLFYFLPQYLDYVFWDQQVQVGADTIEQHSKRCRRIFSRSTSDRISAMFGRNIPSSKIYPLPEIAEYSIRLQWLGMACRCTTLDWFIHINLRTGDAILLSPDSWQQSWGKQCCGWGQSVYSEESSQSSPHATYTTRAAFMLILRRQNQRFETLIQNADPKRR